MTEHVLNYDHSIVPQERFWDCGPASAQVVLSGRSQVFTEVDLINRIGTTVNGTDDISWITPVLNDILGGGYKHDYVRHDPPTNDEKELFWGRLVKSIDSGYGLVANIVAPPSNYPRGVNGSESLRYGGGTVYHYVALMGYKDDGDRAVWWADPGFAPFGAWISFDQTVGLIAPKGYLWQDEATAQPGVGDNPPPDQWKNSEGLSVNKQTWAYWYDLRLRLISDQLGPWPQLNGLTLIDALAEIIEAVNNGRSGAR